MAKKKNKKKNTNVQKQQPAPAKKNNTLWILAAIVAVILIVVLAVKLTGNEKKPADNKLTSTSQTETQQEQPPVTEPEVEAPAEVDYTAMQDEARATLQSDVDYYADIVIQDYGTITVKLEPDVAPITVSNFVSLAEDGFYDGLTFHRIMYGFMMQGGDPLGNGTGGSDQDIVGEFYNNGFENPISHTRGVISMARAFDPDSASSQFFIMHQDNDFLDGEYAAFGCVTEGIEVVDAVCETAQPVDNNGTILAEEQPIMESVTIRTEPKAG